MVSLSKSNADVPTARSLQRLVEIRSLGGFSVVVDGRPLVFLGKAPKRPLSLLKAIIALGTPAACDCRLEDALWPESEADAAHQAFNMALHRLRKLLLRRDAIWLHEGRTWLNPDLCWVDAWAFEQLVTSTAQACESASTHSRLLIEALALYRGAFLAEDGDAIWAIPARERLRDKFVRFVAHHAGRLEAMGQWEKTLQFFHRAIEVNEHTEVFHQGVMRAALHLDRKSEGIAVYARLKKTLPLLLGVAPSADTEQLLRLLLR